MTLHCPSGADWHFGPRVVAQCRRFDFTLFFEQIFFTIVPNTLFLLVCVLRIFQLFGKPRLARYGVLHWTKLSLLFTYVLANLILLILMSSSSIPKTPATVTATALDLLVAACMLPLSHLEHVKSFRPSGLLSAFILLTLLLNIAQVRTYWLLTEDWRGYAACYTAAFALKLLMLVSESWDKTELLAMKDQERCAEERAGILNRGVFAWLNALFLKGCKGRLIFDDLYPVDGALSSHVLSKSLWTSWSSGNHDGRYDLALSLFRCLMWPLLIPITPRLILIAFKFSQPFLVQRVTEYVSNNNAVNDDDIGFGLIGAYGLVYIGLAISKGFYWHFQYRFITMVRGALVTIIYRKTLSVDASLVSGSQATTLMSADIEQIAVGFQYLHEIWANTIEAIVGLWLLEQQIGLSFLAAAVIVITLALYTADVAASRQKVWLVAMEQRLHETTRFLKSSKSIKMLGLESMVFETISKLRATELGKGMHWMIHSLNQIDCGPSGFTPQLLSPPVVFGIFIFTHRTNGTALESTRLFGSIAILSLVTAPLALLFQALPSVHSAFKCFHRIQTYLRLQDVRDPRVRQQSTPNVAVEASKTNVTAGHVMIPTFTVTDASFAWKLDALPVLRGINCSVPSGRLTILIGPVGSGKSTLLQALLGEITQVKGEVRHLTSEIAFCAQHPWLTNTTIRSTIIGSSEANDTWYETVLAACDLDEDIKNLPEGDKTVVGSAGTALSGGQKQRLTLARAVYSRAPVLLLDDIFSGLDRRTEDRILDSLFGVQGLLRKTDRSTVVLVTHAERHLKLGDHIIALNATGEGCKEGPSSLFMAQLAGSLGHETVSNRNPTPTLDNTGTPHNQQGSSEPEPPRRAVPAGDTTIALSDRQVFTHYMRAVSLQHFVLLIIGVAVAGFLQRFPTYWAELWGEANKNGNTSPNNDYYWGIFTMLQLLALVTICWAVWHLFMYVIPTSGKRLHSEVLKVTLGASYAFLSKTDVGSITNRFSQDLLLIDIRLPLSFLNFGLYLVTAIVGYALIAAASVLLLATAPILLTAIYLIQKFYLRTSKSMRLFDLQAKAPLYSQFTDALGGLATIRSFQWMDKLQTENEILLDVSQRPYYLMYCIQRWLTCVLELMVAGLAVTVVGLAVAYRNTSNASAFATSMVSLITLGATLETVVTEYTQLETSIGSVARIKTFVETTPQEDRILEDINASNLMDRQSIEMHPLASQNVVEFRNVSASYGSSNRKVLDDVSLQIRTGEKVAVCGRSGSGKSTLLSVLLRMLDVTNGSLIVRGEHTTHTDLCAHRTKFNTIPQEPYFYQGSFKANLSRGSAITEEKLHEVLREVGLEQKILDLGGLDQECLAEMFSSGECQLLSLARAILHPRGIVLLDEVSSNVDSITDEKMHDIMWKEFKSDTIIAVVHRQELLHRFDRVVVLDQGRVVLQARPSDLEFAGRRYNE
ncbi:P-loop containing nucleoside triphosphate hydrolase protein [Aureobasidium namibiae CBS 147.97]|uniref:p-loop containing nucleoside triphosphate hydrolase protein n=1 Tax=Aureobasidium namibiae CBS 147.97 TaxID=1043004 RepID=A0A074W8H6_9PEZI|nr:P-loop containing nucleoside triphosphate hydrolase protein [Aureobasidium namibiae CBS 147.97]KEQ69415.1 P-loop containing nucleoside triphosphate hydrolase protein [Aureobasidium namibiae CBS 147.97]